jgi:hypothetical protein
VLNLSIDGVLALFLKNVISAREARANFAALFDDAEQGRSHVVMRNLRIAAGIASPDWGVVGNGG